MTGVQTCALPISLSVVLSVVCCIVSSMSLLLVALVLIITVVPANEINKGINIFFIAKLFIIHYIKFVFYIFFDILIDCNERQSEDILT